MRVNVYAEELTDRVEIVKTRDDRDRVFYGVRFYLDSPDSLHHSPSDDDSSAVTIWVPYEEGKHNFEKVINLMDQAKTLLYMAEREKERS